MCRECYEAEYDRPAIINDRVRTAADLIRKVYEWSDSGGNCHVALDDWNLEDNIIDDELENIAHGGWSARNGRGERDSPEQLDAERRCMELMRSMSIDERASALALHSGFITA